MKYKSLFIVPIIAIGWFDYRIKMDGYDWHIRNIFILCLKIELYKRELYKN